MRDAVVSRIGERAALSAASLVPASCVVFTPPALAAGMVRALGDSPRAVWLEPCVGHGAFLEALASAHVPPGRIRGLDIEEKRRSQDELARTLRGQEFLHWSVSTEERFERIIANPPFLALNRMPSAVQVWALKIPIPGTAARVGLGANAWFAFLCASISLLRAKGSLAFVLPAAWDYADYAAPLRASIAHLFEHVEVHRCRQPLFDSVLEGSIVLVARTYRAQRIHGDATGDLKRRKYKTPERLIAALRAPSDKLRTASETPRVVTLTGEAFHKGSESRGAESPAVGRPKKLRLGDVIQIRLGGVTGDARFFVLSEQQRCAIGLPVAACRPIISRAKHLSAGIIGGADWDRLRDDGERVWLFDPPPSQVEHPVVSAYLERPAKDGGCKRTALKVRSRDPWYRTPLEPVIHGFMSGMSGWGPWVVFREMPRLASTNTLYIVRFLNTENIEERAAWAMWLLTSEAARHLRRIARRYADGLVKFEPGDIAGLPIRRPTRIEGAYSAYGRAVRLLLRGKKGASRREADKWFIPSQIPGS